MTSLYEEGWRQGSCFSASLPNDVVVLDGAGALTRRFADHDRWVVASQDCDLAFTDVTAAQPTIELHPVFRQEVSRNPDWGIRSRGLLLATASEYVVSPSPHTLVAAAVLTSLARTMQEPARPLPEVRAAAFKTWLGYRYDRPAVPPGLTPLAKRIKEEVERKRRRPIGQRVRDVLMQFGEDEDPPRFSLYAVLSDKNDEQEVREWLADISRSIPTDVGLGDQLHAAPASGISLELLETSYAADVTQLTWGGAEPEATD